MIRLAARADLGVFHFDEIADVHLAVHDGAGPKPREGSDAAILRDDGMIDDAVGEDFRAFADAGIGDHAVGSDLHAGRQMHLADEHGIDIDENVAAHLDVAANVDAGGIRQRRAGEHQFLRALTPQTRFDLRQAASCR